MLISLLSFLKKPNGSYTVVTYSLRKPLQWVERSLLPKRPKFLQQLISNCYNGYMVINNNNNIQKTSFADLKRIEYPVAGYPAHLMPIRFIPNHFIMYYRAFQ